MQLNMEKEIATLRRMTVAQLKERYAEVFGEHTNANNKPWLIKRVAWRMQAVAEGGLSERARQRAAELANDADLRLSPPKAKPTSARADCTKAAAVVDKGDKRLPMPGTILTRKYKGSIVQVKVLPQGFEFEGEVFKSLSAAAKAITGQHCNGYAFFRLGTEVAP